MLTSYFNAIPQELDEAATIDGATRLQAIRLVILPLVMPGVVTAGIYIFITSWNEYLFAMMLSGQAVRTVTVALQLFIGEFTIQWGLLTAGGTLVALPVTILFLLVQRRLVGGLTAGAVKGMSDMNPIGVISMFYARPFTREHFSTFARMKAAGADVVELLVPEPGELDLAETRRALRRCRARRSCSRRG